MKKIYDNQTNCVHEVLIDGMIKYIGVFGYTPYSCVAAFIYDDVAEAISDCDTVIALGEN